METGWSSAPHRAYGRLADALVHLRGRGTTRDRFHYRVL